MKREEFIEKILTATTEDEVIQVATKAGIGPLDTTHPFVFDLLKNIRVFSPRLFHHLVLNNDKHVEVLCTNKAFGPARQVRFVKEYIQFIRQYDADGPGWALIGKMLNTLADSALLKEARSLQMELLHLIRDRNDVFGQGYANISFDALRSLDALREEDLCDAIENLAHPPKERLAEGFIYHPQATDKLISVLLEKWPTTEVLFAFCGHEEMRRKPVVRDALRKGWKQENTVNFLTGLCRGGSGVELKSDFVLLSKEDENIAAMTLKHLSKEQLEDIGKEGLAPLLGSKSRYVRERALYAVGESKAKEKASLTRR